MNRLRRLLVYPILFGIGASTPCFALAETEPEYNFETQSLSLRAARHCHDSEMMFDGAYENTNTTSSASFASYPFDQSVEQPLVAGTRFPISIESSVSSKTAQVGDLIEARLTDDLRVGGRLIAPKGSRIEGHVCSVQKARKILQAEFSRHRWLKSAGELGVQFDDIVTETDDHLPLVALPAQQARFVKDVDSGRVLGINGKGGCDESRVFADVESRTFAA